MTAVLSVAGAPAISVHVHVPRIGPWFADCDFADDAPAVTGRVTIAIGDATFVGTVQAPRNGVFGLQRRCRIVAGAAAWGNDVTAKSYHNDAGVKGALVARDAAAAVGETLGAATAIAATRLGNDYVRPTGTASRVLEDACRGIAWWVDAAGITQVGTRVSPAMNADDYTVISTNLRHGELELACDDVSKIGIGSVLTAHLEAPLTVTSYEIAATAESLRIHAWCGSGERSALVDAIRGIVERCTDATLDGIYRYRVLGMNGNRADLQRCGTRKDLPNTVATPQWPGVSGAHTTLTRGTEVLVAFIDGDRGQPAIIGFVGRGGPGDVPELLELGGPGGSPVARLGDSVTVFFPPSIPFTGTVAGAPATGLLTILNPGVGLIQSGSSKVQVAP